MRAWRLRNVLRSPSARLAIQVQLPRTLQRSFAKVRDIDPIFSFTPALQFQDAPLQQRSPTPPDERTLKLGKTLRILQPLLPTLLASPLPQEILSPQISLHLFPSTHPHLPTVSGRVAYHAALWTSPITWGKIPLVGNVHLDILSERMVHGSRSQKARDYHHHHDPPSSATISSPNNASEKLIVRWRTAGKTKGLGTGGLYKGIGAGQTVDRITAWLGGDEKRDDREFCGKFIFEFDSEGRIVDHVIERAEEDWSGLEQWENGFGRVVGLTDWLLGRLGGKGAAEQGGLPAGAAPGVAVGCCVDHNAVEHGNGTGAGGVRRRGRQSKT